MTEYPVAHPGIPSDGAKFESNTPVTRTSIYSDTPPANEEPSKVTQVKAEAGNVAGASKEQVGNVAHTAKEQAGEVGAAASSAATSVASSAKEQVGVTLNAVKNQAQEVTAEAKTQLTDQLAAQHTKTADSLHTVANSFIGLADGESSEGVAPELVRQVGTKIDAVATYVENRQPAEMVDDFRLLAKEHPGAFLLGAAGVGFVLARFVKGTKVAAKKYADTEATIHASGVADTYVPDAYTPDLTSTPTPTSTYTGTLHERVVPLGTADPYPDANLNDSSIPGTLPAEPIATGYGTPADERTDLVADTTNSGYEIPAPSHEREGVYRD